MSPQCPYFEHRRRNCWTKEFPSSPPILPRRRRSLRAFRSWRPNTRPWLQIWRVGTEHMWLEIMFLVVFFRFPRLSFSSRTSVRSPAPGREGAPRAGEEPSQAGGRLHRNPRPNRRASGPDCWASCSVGQKGRRTLSSSGKVWFFFFFPQLLFRFLIYENVDFYKLNKVNNFKMQKENEIVTTGPLGVSLA